MACRFRSWSMGLIFSVIALCEPAALLANVRIMPDDEASTVLSGERVNLPFVFVSGKPTAGRLQWSFSVAGRTFLRGEKEVRLADGASFRFELPFDSVALNPQAILEINVHVRYVAVTPVDNAGEHQRKIWLFPRDPLAGRAQWASDLEVELLDFSGQTMQRLDEIEFPYRRITTLTNSQDVATSGLLLVGEGVELEERGTLADELILQILAGRRVLLLAPRDGKMKIPGISPGSPPRTSIPSEFILARENIIRKFDPRLDSLSWMGAENRVLSSRFNWESQNGQTYAVFSPEAKDWPWLQLQFSEPPATPAGALVVCGFRIIEHWEHGPTPRHLFLHVLQAASGKKFDARESDKRQGEVESRQRE